jgi:hypothetical protein
MDAGQNSYPKKTERRPLDRFRNQSALLQQFGEDGIRVYDAIDGRKSSGEIAASLGIEWGKYDQIASFMAQNGMISYSDSKEAPAPFSAPSYPQAPAYPREQPQAPASGAQQPAYPRQPSQYSQPPPSAAYPSAQQPSAARYPSRAQPSQYSQPSPAPKYGQPEQKAPGAQYASNESRGTPAIQPERPWAPKPTIYGREEPQEKGTEQEPYTRPVPAERIQPGEREERPFAPTPPKQPPELGNIAPPYNPSDEGHPVIAPQSGRGEQKQEVETSGVAAMSPLEKLIFGKYGELGILVYNLIDGQKTAEEIMMETGISEVKLVEILEFMDSQGIIKLERPEEESIAPPPQTEQPELRPMVEEKGIENVPEEPSDEKLGIVPIDVPVLNKGNILQKVEINALLTFKYGKQGPALLGMVDGKRDFVQLSLESRLALVEIDAIMGFVGTHNLATFRTMTREEIKKQYGEDGYTIYKKFGRDGVLLYEMIGKEGNLRDIIVHSKIDPERAVEIFMFIHSVLGLELPLDREMLYKQLGIKKPPTSSSPSNPPAPPA